MSGRKYAPLGLLALFTAIAFTFTTCGDKKAPPKINPAFSAYISAFTSGVISKESNIRIRLAERALDAIDYNEPINMDLFDFDPSIDGEVWWIDDRTLEFRPEEAMTSGEIYNVEFNLEELAEVPEDLETFEFQFSIIQQSMDVSFDGVRTYEKRVLQWQKILGTVTTADVVDEENIEKVLSAKQDKRKLNISWEHNTNRTEHYFRIDSINRTEEPGEVVLKWQGNPIGVDEDGEENAA